MQPGLSLGFIVILFQTCRGALPAAWETLGKPILPVRPTTKPAPARLGGEAQRSHPSRHQHSVPQVPARCSCFSRVLGNLASSFCVFSCTRSPYTKPDCSVLKGPQKSSDVRVSVPVSGKARPQPHLCLKELGWGRTGRRGPREGVWRDRRWTLLLEDATRGRLEAHGAGGDEPTHGHFVSSDFCVWTR